MKVEAIWPPVLRFLSHLALATYGIVALSFLPEIPLRLIIGSQDRFLDYFVVGPTFGLPIILGFLAGHRFGRRLPALASRPLWVPPFVLLVSQIYLEYEYRWAGEDIRAQLWNNYVGINCGASECLSEALLTAPLVAALAYSLGAELGRMKARKSRRMAAARSQ
jgi:hypothetical protein